MENIDNIHFITIVAGDNPDSIMEYFKLSEIDEPWIVYHYEDREQLLILQIWQLKMTSQSFECRTILFFQSSMTRLASKPEHLKGKFQEDLHMQLLDFVCRNLSLQHQANTLCAARL